MAEKLVAREIVNGRTTYNFWACVECGVKVEDARTADPRWGCDHGPYGIFRRMGQASIDRVILDKLVRDVEAIKRRLGMSD